MNVLITGGGCSERIDDVRSVTNFSSGKTALAIARKIVSLNPAARVTLLLSKSAAKPTGILLKKAEARQFSSCADLKALLEEELSKNSYDLVFHAAAVSDYTVQSLVVDGREFLPSQVKKLSGAKSVSINLKLNPKLLAAIPRLAKKNNKGARVVGFKLTARAGREERERAVQKLFAAKNPPDFVLSNDLSEITPRRHPCVLWHKGGRLAEGPLLPLVEKIYAFDR